MRVKWTRDEVILALDVMINARGESLGMDDPRILELSALLNRLPIIPLGKRPDTFRNVAGVRRQILTFAWSIKKNKVAPHVGDVFYNVYKESLDKLEWLHEVAMAIRKCENMVQEITFDNALDENSFPEGIILGHLHRHLERVKGQVYIECKKKCCACGICQDHIYQVTDNVKLLEPHFLRPPETYCADMVLGGVDFIPVCPNCHHILHQIRPWLGRNDVKRILKKL